MVSQLSIGIPVKVFDNVTMPADATDSVAVAVPRGQGEAPRDVAWFTSFDSAPTTINIEIYQSVDGTNYVKLDAGSSTAGDFKTIRGVLARFLRMRVHSSTGGSKITGGFVC